MVVIAVMPAAGLLISIGEILSYDQPEFISTCYYRWNSRTNRLGGYRNLHILFALAIGGSWAKERAGVPLQLVSSS